MLRSKRDVDLSNQILELIPIKIDALRSDLHNINVVEIAYIRNNVNDEGLDWCYDYPIFESALQIVKDRVGDRVFFKRHSRHNIKEFDRNRHHTMRLYNEDVNFLTKICLWLRGYR